MGSIFSLFGTVYVDNSEANKKIDQTGKKAKESEKSFTSAISTIGKWGAAIATGAVAGATALYGVASKAAETADEIDKMSQKLGLSRTAYQKWGYVLSQNGMEIASLGTGMKTLTNKIDDAVKGNESAIEMFDQLGISLEDLNEMTREEIFEAAIEGFQGMSDSAERAALANDIFGRSGAELTPLFNQTIEDTEQLKNNFEEMGLAIGDDAIDAGVQFTDMMDTLQRAFQAVAVSIGAEVMPIITQAVDWLMAHMPEIQSVMSVVFDAIGVVVSKVVTILSNFFAMFTEKAGAMGVTAESLKSDLLNVFEFIGETFNKFAEVIKGVVGVFQLYWPQIVDAAQPVVDSLVSMWKDHLAPMFEALANAGKNAFESLAPYFMAAFNMISDIWVNMLCPLFETIIDFITYTFSTSWEEKWTDICGFFEEIWNGMVDFVKVPINSIIGFVNKMIEGIEEGINYVVEMLNTLSFTVPDWVPSIGGSTFGFDIDEVDLGRIEELAKGGSITAAGSAIVGEDGAELIDLPRGATVTPLNDNNNAIVELREMQSETNALLNQIIGLIPQTIDIDGRTFGRLTRKYGRA